MTTAEMIKKYDVTLVIMPDGDKMAVHNVRDAQRDNMIETLKASKPEIVAYLRREKEEAERAAAEREAKIQAIEGLDELRNAITAASNYRRAFRRMMDDEYNDGAFAPAKPETTPDAVSAKYPRAAAYIKAEEWYASANYDKSAAGKKAMEAIINGEDYASAIQAMEDEWNADCKGNIWG